MNSETPERKYYPISNDKMFAAVLASNPDLAQQMIETILDIRIDHVVCVNAQQILNYNANVKSVRFDVYIKDQAGVIYDVEMQASPKNRRWLPKRSRYYGSVIDAETVKSGTSYKDIKNTYIIFICTYDPFDEGLARYTGKTMCLEDPGVTMEDGITHIYLNARAVRKNVSEELAVYNVCRRPWRNDGRRNYAYLSECQGSTQKCIGRACRITGLHCRKRGEIKRADRCFTAGSEPIQ